MLRISHLLFCAAFGLLAFVWNAKATCAVPNDLSNGQNADATQVMLNFDSILNCVNTAPAGSTNALQYNFWKRNFGAVGPLANGQVAIGSTGGTPVPAQLTAGTGIIITNGPGSIAISAAGSPYMAPILSDFTWGNWPAGSTAADTSTGLAVYTPENGGSENEATLWDSGTYPLTPFTFVVGISATQLAAATPSAGLAIGDGSGKMVRFCIYNGGNDNIQVSHITYTTFGSQSYNITANNIRFLAVKDDGTNLLFYVGADLNAMVLVYQESRTAWLATPTQLGLTINSADTSYGTAATFFEYAK